MTPRLLRALAPVALALTLATCRDALGPTPGGLGRMAVAPIFPSDATIAEFGLAIDRVRVVVVRPAADTLADTTVALPADAAFLDLDLRVPLVTSPETLSVSIVALSGTTPLFQGTSNVEVRSGVTAGPPAEIPVDTYVGPGAGVDSLVVQPRAPFLYFSDSLRFQVQAFQGGVPVTQFYVSWSTSDTTLARINGFGVLRAPASRTSVQVRARTPSGTRDSTTVTFVPLPTQLVTIAGGGQTGGVGQPLEVPLEVEVRAGDNLPVAGVGVRFRSLSGGAPGDTTVTSDAAGRARVLGVLGPVAGSQTFQATVPAFPTIPPAGFNVTATGVIARTVSWTNPAGGNWSNPANWNGGVVPGAGDTVFITLGGTYTVTVDVNDTVAFLSVGGGSGTQTLAITSHTFGIDSAASFGPSAVVNLGSSTINGPNGTIVNQGMLNVQSCTIAPALANAGFVKSRGTVAFNGDFTTAPGSTLLLEGDAFFSTATLTVLNGFVNLGTIELTAINSTGITAELSVTNGTLINVPGGVISALPGAGGTRHLSAQLDNQGTITVNQSLTISKTSATHQNSGTIDMAGANLILTLAGVGASFTTSGNITIASGRTLDVSSGGSFNYSGGTIAGAGSIVWSGPTVNLSQPFSNTTLAVTLSSATVNGPGSFTNASGRTLVVTTSILNASLDNHGMLVMRGGSAFNGAVTTATTSTMRVEGDAFFSSAHSTFQNGFTNNGVIELTAINAAGIPAQLTVTNGTLVNASGATIDVVAGAGGERFLNAALENHGSVKVNQALTLNRASALHSNRGTIDVTGGDLIVSQSGGNPSLVNTTPGFISIAAGRTLKITSGNVTNDAGAKIGGSGTFDVSPPVTFSNAGELVPGASAGILTVVGNPQLNASATLTMELGGPTEGTEHDQLRITGDASLGGFLNVTTINGFNPAGNTFIVVRSGGNAGGTRFGVANLPAGCSQPSYTPTTVQFTCS